MTKIQLQAWKKIIWGNPHFCSDFNGWEDFGLWK